MEGYEFSIKGKGCNMFMKDMFYAYMPVVNGLFILNLDDGENICHINAKRLKPNDMNPSYLWHCHHGHISEKRMKMLHDVGLLKPSGWEPYGTCEACLLGKMTKSPFNKSAKRAIELLELIHTDVCGPMTTTARGGYRYFITFTDDLSRYGYVYLMKRKSETFEVFK